MASDVMVAKSAKGKASASASAREQTSALVCD